MATIKRRTFPLTHTVDLISLPVSKQKTASGSRHCLDKNDRWTLSTGVPMDRGLKDGSRAEPPTRRRDTTAAYRRSLVTFWDLQRQHPRKSHGSTQEMATLTSAVGQIGDEMESMWVSEKTQLASPHNVEVEPKGPLFWFWFNCWFCFRLFLTATPQHLSCRMQTPFRQVNLRLRRCRSMYCSSMLLCRIRLMPAGS